MVDENSDEYRLAEAVAELTAQRFRAGLKEEMDARDERLLELWREDMGKLRDDLTAKGLLEELRGMPIQADGEDGLSAVRVLVVDDYPAIRRAFVKMFTASGMLVREAEDGAAAVEILDNDHMIEVVVADISMPKNGYTLLEHVRHNFPVIEVILTSGFDIDAERARKIGAFGFLPKPFNLAQAVLIVERAAEFRRLKLAVTSKG